MTKLITVEEFIEQVWKIEGIKIKLGLSNDRLVPPYPYTKPAPGGITIDELLETRLKLHINKAMAN